MQLRGLVEDLPTFIRSSFAAYAVFNPERIPEPDGVMLYVEVMQKKGRWADALIDYVKTH